MWEQMFLFVSEMHHLQNSSYLSHGVRQNLNDLLVRRRHDALAVDLDDAVTDADASSLSDASPHQAADLNKLKTQGELTETGSLQKRPLWQRIIFKLPVKVTLRLTM